jgi:hypothetical protein
LIIWTRSDRAQLVHLQGKEAAVVVGAMGGGDKQEHWLTEGFGPADLREAKALLEEVF